MDMYKNIPDIMTTCCDLHKYILLLKVCWIILIALHMYAHCGKTIQRVGRMFLFSLKWKKWDMEEVINLHEH